MMDPEFLAGSEHVAHCPVTNPTGKQWTYDAELYLVKDETKYATSGTVSFTLAAGASDTIDFPIVMPATSGTYKVYLDVYVSGELITAYQATEDVVVVVTGEATLDGNVDLEGRPATAITIRFFEPGTNTEVIQASTTTDNSGNFRITGITPGTYDVCVKGYTSLSILSANQVFIANSVTTISFGILLEGDANDDDYITEADKELVEGVWGTQEGDPNFNPKCDFNRDGWVDGKDRNLMYTNWGLHGDCVECLEGATECRNSDLYECVNGRWQLVEENSPECILGELPELPPDFEIDSIAAEPPIVVLGNPVSIKVTWCAPGSIEFWIDRELGLQCVIDGETLQRIWTYTGSTTIRFEYTPTSIGTYTATISGNGISKFNCPESVSFEVREEVVGPFYSPYGELCKWDFPVVVCKPAETPYATLDALANEMAGSAWTRDGGVWEAKTVSGAGRSSDIITCPYCSKYFTACIRPAGLSCQRWQRLGAVYLLLEHIQSLHPDHPLTEPLISG